VPRSRESCAGPALERVSARRQRKTRQPLRRCLRTRLRGSGRPRPTSPCPCAPHAGTRPSAAPSPFRRNGPPRDLGQALPWWGRIGNTDAPKTIAVVDHERESRAATFREVRQGLVQLAPGCVGRTELPPRVVAAQSPLQPLEAPWLQQPSAEKDPECGARDARVPGHGKGRRRFAESVRVQPHFHVRMRHIDVCPRVTAS
jgi:hypothetical protein